ncbi:type II secretion system protein [Oleiharenicola lentus]|uniref:Type II secretion system protein n=1 Tax=Oleiharenicola lentus TaxID=2508720 RepID=A0A4Q1CB33_9BACT|nr:type II secretion system protein GspG [Oleiharenicola lentus]RXK56305.1 type II secretion system protein [Oleiharenicola lentus]
MSLSAQLRPARSRGAFTLLELLVVIGLIAILTGLVLGAGRRASDAGKASRARAELTALAAALDAYRLAHGDYPRTDEPARLLQALIGKRGPDHQVITSRAFVEVARLQTADARDPFTDDSAVLLDPWGRPYRYAYKSQAPWTNSAPVLHSAGPDGTDTTSLTAGGFPDRSASGNADNLYADQP